MSIKLHKKTNNTKNENEDNISSVKMNSTLDVQSLYKILIKNPSLVNAIDDKKETILSYSIKNHNIPVSKLVLTSPILELNYEDNDGNSYLHLATLYKQEELVKSLIEKKIFLNKKNKEGNTALHLAYMIHHKEIINILEENGIDTNILNKNDKKAEEMNSILNQGPSKFRYNNSLLNKDMKTKIKIEKNSNIFSDNNNINLKNTKIKKSNCNQSKSKINSTNKNNNINNNNIQTNLNNNAISIIPYNCFKTKLKESELTINIKNATTKKNEKIDTSEEILSIEDYKTRFQNCGKKYPYIDKNIKIDSELKNIDKNNKFLNAELIEKKENNIEQEQCIENIEDKCNNNSFSADDKNDDKKIAVNKKFNTYINTNRASPKMIKNKMKKLCKKNRNNNVNTCFGNSVGVNNKTCLSNDYSTQSEKKFAKMPSGKKIKSKIDMSSSTKDIHNVNKSKINNIINNHEEVLDFSENNNMHKNLNTERVLDKTSQNKNPNKKVTTSKNNCKTNNAINTNKNKEEKNNNMKESNLDPYKKNQKNATKSNQKDNVPLLEFLSQINLKKYFHNMDSNGFDDINILIEEAKKGALIKDQELKEVGIEIPGDRAKILIRIKEKANIFGFILPKGVYHTCQNLKKINEDNYIMGLKKWLKTLKVENYLMNFVNSGYHSLELLLIQMNTESPLNSELLRDEIGIDIIGYRSRILNKLREDGRNMYNKLKTSTIIVNNIDNDKNCECIII